MYLWYIFPRKDRKVASKQSDRRSVMLFTLRLVWDLMNSTKAREFLTWELVKPTIGESIPARNLEQRAR